MELIEKINKNGVSLVAGSLIANAIALGFNALLGRVLSYENFGILTFISALYIFLYIIANAAAYTVTHKVAFFMAKKQPVQAANFYDSFANTLMKSSVIATIIFLLVSPLLTALFKLPNFFILVLFSSAITATTLLNLYRGYLQGNLDYLYVSFIMIGESVGRLVIAAVCIALHQSQFVYLAVPFADVLVVGIAYMMLRNRVRNAKKKTVHGFPTAFFNASIITGFSSYAFVTFDVLLVKMFVSPKVAGMYALLALVGKIIYFLGSVLNAVLFTIVSRDLGLDYNPYPVFYRFLAIVFGLVAGAVLILTFFGNPLVPLLFGAKTVPILSNLPMYAIGIGCFTFCSTIVTFHLAKEEYVFPWIAIGFALLMAVGICIYHRSVDDIVRVIFVCSVTCLILLVALHIHSRFSFLDKKKIEEQ